MAQVAQFQAFHRSLLAVACGVFLSHPVWADDLRNKPEKERRASAADNWNGAFKNDCACTRCGAHHSWEELERHEWSTTYGYFDEDSPGTIHDTGIVTGEIEHGETKSKCVMCGEKVTHTWSDEN